MFKRLAAGISRTRNSLLGGLKAALGKKKSVDATTIEALESALLMADCGIETTARIVDGVKARGAAPDEQLVAAVIDEMTEILANCEAPLDIPKQHQGTFVILVVGVNGAGKTTTIAKIGRRLKDSGCSVMFAAGDTFRAAAVEQLSEWGRRLDIPVIAQSAGADPAAVIFDACSAAAARNIDVLIADTAGRLHTQSNLMAELKKVKRVIEKFDRSAPHETMLVLDATMGQNALVQAKLFHAQIELDAITLTKLDGTAKGGILFALAVALGLPIRFVGVGEDDDALQTFRARDFAEALFAEAPFESEAAVE
jgi:fused signal recognition particle receptor